MELRIKSLLSITALLVMLLSVPLNAEAPSLLISRIKTGGMVANQLTEYVSIYNKTDEQVDLSGWTIEYAKPNARITDCDAASWKQQDSSTNVQETDLAGVVPSH